MKSIRFLLVILTLCMVMSNAYAANWDDFWQFVHEILPGQQDDTANDDNSADSETGAYEERVVACTYTDLMGNEKAGFQIGCFVGYGSCIATICR